MLRIGDTNFFFFSNAKDTVVSNDVRFAIKIVCVCVCERYVIKFLKSIIRVRVVVLLLDQRH